MNGLLLDTQLLVWVGYAPQRLGSSLAAELVDRRHVIWFSVVSIWEMAIQVSHVLAVQHLPRIHRDPFDRLLVAQAAQERLSLITADRTLLGYGDGVRWVG
jgi:PIN domain nuclease of toxin-antitoxin system